MQELTREKFLSKEELQKLRDCLLSQMLLAKRKGNIRGVKPYYIFEFMINTGVRVSELCNLKHRDLDLSSRTPHIKVIAGKGNKDRRIYIPSEFRKTAYEYLEWKKNINEPFGEDDYVFYSELKRKYSPRTIQLLFKYYKSLLKINSKCTPHSLRHSFAVYLYERNKDLRMLMRQMGHASVQTTTIYADLTPENICKQMDGLWS